MKWHLKGKPYDVQSAAMEKASGKDGFAYFMEMGLGKSAVALNEAVDLVKRGEVDDVSVVCPPSLKSNWAEEITKWEVPLKGHVWPDLPNSNQPTVSIINYEAFSGGAQRGYSHFLNVAKNRRLLMILDESIQIKGPDSIRTKNLLSISPFLSHRRILSGAPITQGPQDAWTQLRFLGALKGSNYYGFRNKFCNMGGFKGKQVIGAKNSAELHELLDCWGFRAKKSDWTDLPPKQYHKREIGLSKVLQSHYFDMETKFITGLQNGSIVEAAQVVTQLLKLQQITSGFINDEFGECHILDENPPKYKELLNILEEISGKVLVFTHFRPTTTLLHKRLQDNYGAAIMIGGMTDSQISAEKKRFNEDSSCRVFVIQADTGKYGHTLLGSAEPNNRCSTTVFYENSYNLDTRLQSEDRNHRHGQDAEMVNYIDLFSSPVDLRAVVALQKKLNIATEVVDGVTHGSLPKLG